MSRISVTQNEVDQVIELFRSSIESNLEEAPDVNLDIHKIINEFQNLLYQRVERVPSAEDDNNAQDLKMKIENLQKKALRLKSTLHSTRNLVVQQVQMQAEEVLKEQSDPLVIPEPSDLQDDSDDIEESPEFQEHLRILDETIAQLQRQIIESNRSSNEIISKYASFEKDTSKFLKST